MSLSEFLQTFNNPTGGNVYRIDPVNYFRVALKYIPDDTTVNHNKIFGFKTDYDITPFIQSIELPSISITNDTAADTIVGSIQTHKMYITPSEQTFRVSLINTKYPLVENWLYPWLREITQPEWNYADYPYTKAEFIIDMTEHNNVKYVLNGCRPTALPSFPPTHELTSKLTREVTFTFDYFWVETSADVNNESLIKSLATKLTKTIGL